MRQSDKDEFLAMIEPGTHCDLAFTRKCGAPVIAVPNDPDDREPESFTRMYQTEYLELNDAVDFFG
jgi:hypothetical protein